MRIKRSIFTVWQWRPTADFTINKLPPRLRRLDDWTLDGCEDSPDQVYLTQTLQYLTLRRWARRTWRAPCPPGRLRRGVASLCSEEARTGSCCRTGAAPEMGGDTAPLSCPPKPCPPATAGAHCWKKRRRKREEMKKPNVLHHRIIYSLQFCICCFASDSIKSNAALSVRTCLVPAAARSRWPALWPPWRRLFL